MGWGGQGPWRYQPIQRQPHLSRWALQVHQDSRTGAFEDVEIKQYGFLSVRQRKSSQSAAATGVAQHLAAYSQYPVLSIGGSKEQNTANTFYSFCYF